MEFFENLSVILSLFPFQLDNVETFKPLVVLVAMEHARVPVTVQRGSHCLIMHLRG